MVVTIHLDTEFASQEARVVDMAKRARARGYTAKADATEMLLHEARSEMQTGFILDMIFACKKLDGVR